MIFISLETISTELDYQIVLVSSFLSKIKND